MSYFSGPANPDDFEDGYDADAPAKSNRKLKLAVVFIILGLLGTTFAANISLNGGNRKEFGQGILQIKACDQWVGVGVEAGAGSENIYVKNVKLYGFDPRLCYGRIFKIRLFASGSQTPLNLYIDDSSTAGYSDTSTTLSLMDTSTAYTGSYQGLSGQNAYDAWAGDAVTLVNKLGTNVGWINSRIGIDYTTGTGVYTIVFTQPLALVAQVATVTIESAKYS